MQIAINFQNETIAKKVLWMLDHFKNDGVEIIAKDEQLAKEENSDFVNISQKHFEDIWDNEQDDAYDRFLSV